MLGFKKKEVLLNDMKNHSDLIKEMITKALEGLNEEIDLVKEEFERL